MSQSATFLRVKRRRDENPLETIVLESAPSKQHRIRQNTTTSLVNLLSSLEIDQDQQTKTHSSGFVSRSQNLSKYLPPSRTSTLFDSIRAQNEETLTPLSELVAEDIPDTNIAVVSPRKCSSPPHPVLLSTSPPSICVIGSLPDAVETPTTVHPQASGEQTAITIQRDIPLSSTPRQALPPASQTPASGFPTTSTIVYRRVATLPPVRARVRRRDHADAHAHAHAHAHGGSTAGEDAEDTRHRKRQLTDATHAALLRAQLGTGARLGAEGSALTGAAGAVGAVGAVGDAASAPGVAFVDVGVAENAAALRQSRKHRVELARLREARMRMAHALGATHDHATHTATEIYRSERSAAVLGRAHADRSVLEALYGGQDPGESYGDAADDTLTGALYQRYCQAAVPRRGGQAVYTQRVDEGDTLAGMDADTAAFLSAKRAQHGRSGGHTSATGAQGEGALGSDVCVCVCRCASERSCAPHAAASQRADDRLAALFARGQASGRTAQAVDIEDDDAFLARLQAQPLGKNAPPVPADATASGPNAAGADDSASACVCACTCAAADTEQDEDEVFDVYEPVPDAEVDTTGLPGPDADANGAVSVCVLTGAELEELFGEDVELLHEGEWGYSRDPEDSDVDVDADALEIDYPDEDDSEDSAMDEYDAEEAEFVMHCLRMRRDDDGGDGSDDDDDRGYGVRTGGGYRYRQTLPAGARVGGGRESWGFVGDESDEDDEYGGSNAFARMRTWVGAAAGANRHSSMGDEDGEDHH